jgi:hypothetical protein
VQLLDEVRAMTWRMLKPKPLPVNVPVSGKRMGLSVSIWVICGQFWVGGRIQHPASSIEHPNSHVAKKYPPVPKTANDRLTERGISSILPRL